MRVNIVTGDGIKHKYTVENLDSAVDIIKDYAKENNLNYEGPSNGTIILDTDKPKLLGIAHFFEYDTDEAQYPVKRFKGSAFIWSK